MALNRPSDDLSQKTNVNPVQDRQQEATAQDFEEISTLLSEYADAIEALQAGESPNPYYGSYTSLALLQAAYPTGEEDAWAIIDAGAGVTPQIAAWDDSEEEWQIVGFVNNIVPVNTYANLPTPGTANTLYITLSTMYAYIWNSTSYVPLKSPSSFTPFNRLKVVDVVDTDPTSVIVGNYVRVKHTASVVDYILFDPNFSEYLADINTLDNDFDFALTIYNTTQGKFIAATNISFAVVNTNYYKCDVSNSHISSSDFSESDELQFYFQLYGGSGGASTASQITIEDSGELFDADNVEDALAEVMQAVNNINPAGAFEFETEITATTTTFDGSQKGLNKVYPQNNASASTITIENGDYSENDVINIERRGQGTLEIVQDTDVRFRGVRDIDNRFFINDANSMVSLICRGSDGTNDVFSIIGNLKRGYTGAVTTSAYGSIESSETKDVPVVGTGFSSNMLVSLTGNATLNSWTYVDNNNITLNITSSGTDGDFLTITYDNGDVFVDTNAIQLTDVAALSIVIETTSTSATWSPSAVNNSGDTLRWTVSGDASGVYDANDPTIDLSSNTGTAIITITSNDDLAGLTTCRFTSLAITSADVSDWTACTELWFFGNSLGGNLTGTENLTNATKFDLRENGLTSLSLPSSSTLTELQLDINPISSITGLSSATGLEILDINNNSAITTIDLSSNIALTSFVASNCSSFSSITGLSNLTALETLNVAIAAFDTIDLTGATSLDNVRFQANSLDVSTINNMILDLDAFGVSNGTLNYSSQSPTANPTATENTTDDVLDAYNSLVGKGWTITGATPA